MFFITNYKEPERLVENEDICGAAIVPLSVPISTVGQFIFYYNKKYVF